MDKQWQEAVRHGDLAALQQLLHQDVAINSKDRYGQTALMIAAKLGRVEVVRFLVQRGADLNVTAKYNLTALMLAVLNGHTEIVRTLKNAGADTAIRGTGAPGFSDQTALDLARRCGRHEIAAVLSGGPS
jgi:ankyrin repeat protein